MMAGDDEHYFLPTSHLRRPARRAMGVHTLSEHVFCPRAGVIASESDPDTGDEEPNLGPRLDAFADYDERLFHEALQAGWSELQLWLTVMAPVVLVELVAWHFRSVPVGIVLSLPILILLTKSWETLVRIISLVRARIEYRAAVAVEIDLNPTWVRKLNWWSLRKAGFDCIRLVDALSDSEFDLIGRPWRLLRKGNTIGVPVIRRRRGCPDWGPQHEVRLAAYCHLIEKCEGRKCPFGVILLAGTNECVIIPNTPALQTQFRTALRDAFELRTIWDGGKSIPGMPTDNRCSGCPRGAPRRLRTGSSETVLNGTALKPYVTNSVSSVRGHLRGTFHCDCGDRFKWVPPHRDAIALGIAKE